MRLLFIMSLAFALCVNACTTVEEENSNVPIITEEEPLEHNNFDLLLGFNDKTHDSIGVERHFHLKEDSLFLVKKSWGHHITDPEHDAILVEMSHKETMFKVIRSLDLHGNYEKSYPGEIYTNHYAKFKMGKMKTIVKGGEGYLDDGIATDLESFGTMLEALVKNKVADFERISAEFVE